MKVKKNLGLYYCLMTAWLVWGCAAAPDHTAVQTTAAQPDISKPSEPVAGVDLDTAVKEAALEIEQKLPQGTKVALVNLGSPSAVFSEQVLLRFESALVRSGKVVVVDRANLDKIRAEQGFHLSGEVDEDSAKAIGKLLGAGAIVTGSTVDLGDVYGLALKAINIETATVAASYLADLAKTERIKTLMASVSVPAKTQPAAASGAAAQAPAAPATPAPAVYKIGDKGPAGGWIFYDKGNNSGGWRYLEAAPRETEFKAEWGRNISVDGTSLDVGTGKANTQRIITASKRREQEYKDEIEARYTRNGEIVKLVGAGEEAAAYAATPAAQRCTALNINGYADWFLPSKSDLGWMYVNLKMKGLGDFRDDYYWSSSQSRTDYFTNGAWVQRFSNGSQTNNANKYDTYSVRAVRTF